MSTIEQAIEIDVPVRTAYNQWTRFEEFPHFMEGVKAITRLDETRLRWKAEIGGREREWEAEITEQTPDQRIAWSNQGGASRVVTFQPLSDTRSKIRLQVAYIPEGPIESLAEEFREASSRIQRNLEQFKAFIEKRAQEIGVADTSRLH
jgi:uncharacterized membrane protein